MMRYVLTALILLTLNGSAQAQNDVLTLNERAVESMESGQPDSAYYYLFQAIKEDSTFYGTHYNLGVLNRDMGKTEEAIINFTKTISLNDKDTISYMNRGIIHAKLHNYELATADFIRVTKLDPRNKEAFLNLGIIDNVLSRLPESEERFLKCLELDTNYHSAMFELAKTYIEQQKFDTAFSLLNKAILLCATKPEYFELRAIMNQMKGDKKSSCKDMETAFKLGSVDEVIHRIYSRECN